MDKGATDWRRYWERKQPYSQCILITKKKIKISIFSLLDLFGKF